VSLTPQKQSVRNDAVASSTDGDCLRRERRVAGPLKPVVERSEIGDVGPDGEKFCTVVLRCHPLFGLLLVWILSLNGSESPEPEKQHAGEKETNGCSGVPHGL